MKFFAKIKDKLLSWRRSEPVRTTVYPLIVLALGFFVGTGKIDLSTSNMIDLAVGLILGVGGTEAARAKVTPTARVQDRVQEHVEAQVQVAVNQIDKAVTDAQAELESNGSAVSQAASNVLNQISDVVQKFGQGRHSKLEQVE